MSQFLTFLDVMCELHIGESRLNYILKRDGITATVRCGRGRGGGRMFLRTQLKEIRKSIGVTRQYKRKDVHFFP